MYAAEPRTLGNFMLDQAPREVPGGAYHRAQAAGRPEGVWVFLPELPEHLPLRAATLWREEVRALRGLSLPGGLLPEELTLEGPVPFAVFRAQAAPELARYCRRSERLPLQRCLDLTRDIGELLSALHGARRAHLCLSPQDIYVHGEKVAVGGLGVHPLVALGQLDPSRPVLRGLAPELFERGRGDLRSDIYSLAVIFYQLVTGVHPLGGGKKATRPTWDEVAPPRVWNPNLPEGFDALCLRALSREPHQRPGSVEEFLEELDEALEAEYAADVTLPPEPALFTTDTGQEPTPAWDPQATVLLPDRAEQLAALPAVAPAPAPVRVEAPRISPAREGELPPAPATPPTRSVVMTSVLVTLAVVLPLQALFWMGRDTPEVAPAEAPAPAPASQEVAAAVVAVAPPSLAPASPAPAPTPAPPTPTQAPAAQPAPGRVALVLSPSAAPPVKEAPSAARPLPPPAEPTPQVSAAAPPLARASEPAAPPVSAPQASSPPPSAPVEPPPQRVEPVVTALASPFGAPPPAPPPPTSVVKPLQVKSPSSQGVGPGKVAITANLVGDDGAELSLVWRSPGKPWSRAPMYAAGGGRFEVTVEPGGVPEIEYYFEATASSGARVPVGQALPWSAQVPAPEATRSRRDTKDPPMSF